MRHTCIIMCSTLPFTSAEEIPMKFHKLKTNISDGIKMGSNVELIRDLNESLIAKYIENDRSNGLERASQTQISNAVKESFF